MDGHELVSKRIDALLERAFPASTNPERTAIFGAFYALLVDISEHCQELIPGMDDVLADLRWHTNAMLRLDITNAHEIGKHHVWVIGALQRLEGKLRVGQSTNASR